MAAALARGWAGASPRPDSMLFTDSGSGRAQALADELGGERLASVSEMADRADLVVLAVKPAGLDDVATEIAGRTGAVISVLGATPLERLAPALAPTPVLRTMPNLAVEIGEGVICHAEVPSEHRSGAIGEALGLLGAIATVVEVEESQLDPATAVMGCAPAYIALAVEALIEAGVGSRIGRRAQLEARQRGRGRGRQAPADARARRDATGDRLPGRQHRSRPGGSGGARGSRLVQGRRRSIARSGCEATRMIRRL